MAKDLSALWTEKYRPRELEDYVFQDERLESSVNRWISEQTIPHLLLSGVQGSGKTTLSQMLVNKLDVDPTDVLVVNASDETSVDVMRDKVKGFVTTWAMSDSGKIVRLEEADYLSQGAQAILRDIMETYADVARFILTCNYDHKIIPALKSRCQEYRFRAFDRDDVTEQVANILIEEKIKFSLDLIDKYVAAGYPDIRKIINLLQQNSLDGVLQPPTEVEAGDYKFQMMELLESDKWLDIRKLLCANVTTEEWEGVYRFLYENLNKSAKFSVPKKWEEGIVTIADHLYKHGLMADPEINATAMFIRLAQL